MTAKNKTIRQRLPGVTIHKSLQEFFDNVKGDLEKLHFKYMRRKRR